MLHTRTDFLFGDQRGCLNTDPLVEAERAPRPARPQTLWGVFQILVKPRHLSLGGGAFSLRVDCGADCNRLDPTMQIVSRVEMGSADSGQGGVNQLIGWDSVLVGDLLDCLNHGCVPLG